MRIRRLVDRLRLRPHPEGGWYREVHRSSLTVALPGSRRRRPAFTSILYLLEEGARSRLHRIRTEEAWVHHAGGPIEIVEMDARGRIRRTRLGPPGAPGTRLQHVVPPGRWFGAAPLPGTRYALVGCLVAPGFEFADLELADAAALARRHPARRAFIRAWGTGARSRLRGVSTRACPTPPRRSGRGSRRGGRG